MKFPWKSRPCQYAKWDVRVRASSLAGEAAAAAPARQKPTEGGPEGQRLPPSSRCQLLELLLPRYLLQLLQQQQQQLTIRGLL